MRSLLTRNSFLAKLDKDGNQLWNKSKDIGDLKSEYSIKDLYEDASGDYFLLLHNQRSSIAVIRSDSAYNIQWSRTFYNNTQIYSMKMKRVQNAMLTYFTEARAPLAHLTSGLSA